MTMFKFKLSPGQQTPPGNTGRGLAGGYIAADMPAWPTGKQVVHPGPPEVSFMWEDVTHSVMSAAEITADDPEERIKAETIERVDTDESLRRILIAMAIITQDRMKKLKANTSFPDSTIEELVTEVKGLIGSGVAK